MKVCNTIITQGLCVSHTHSSHHYTHFMCCWCECNPFDLAGGRWDTQGLCVLHTHSVCGSHILCVEHTSTGCTLHVQSLIDVHWMYISCTWHACPMHIIIIDDVLHHHTCSMHVPCILSLMVFMQCMLMWYTHHWQWMCVQHTQSLMWYTHECVLHTPTSMRVQPLQPQGGVGWWIPPTPFLFNLRSKCPLILSSMLHLSPLLSFKLD